jgi:hypothetical protein
MRKINISKEGRRLDTIGIGDVLVFDDERDEKVVLIRDSTRSILKELWTYTQSRKMFTKYDLTANYAIFPNERGLCYHLNKKSLQNNSLSLNGAVK